MNIARFLKAEYIGLHLEAPEIQDELDDAERSKSLWQIKERVLQALVDLLDRSGKVVNRHKLFVDMLNREKKASTGMEAGVAIPHVRTKQARGLAMAFARCREGIDFDAADGHPVRLFLAIVAPPYDDQLYLKLYQKLAPIFANPDLREGLLAAESEHEIIRLFQAFSR